MFPSLARLLWYAEVTKVSVPCKRNVRCLRSLRKVMKCYVVDYTISSECSLSSSIDKADNRWIQVLSYGYSVWIVPLGAIDAGSNRPTGQGTRSTALSSKHHYFDHPAVYSNAFSGHPPGDNSVVATTVFHLTDSPCECSTFALFPIT